MASPHQDRRHERSLLPEHARLRAFVSGLRHGVRVTEPRPGNSTPYGEGIYRRRIVLQQPSATTVRADLEDDFHRFGLTLKHDGRRVVSINAEGSRYPWSTCPSAAGPLRALESMVLSRTLGAVTKIADPRANCTHLFDLAMLAIMHAAAGRRTRRYDVTCPDWKQERSVVTLDVDEQRALTWEIHEHDITAPAPFAGQKIAAGAFLRWARTELDDETAERAFVLWRGCMISWGRVMNLDDTQRASELLSWTGGNCYSFLPEIAPDGYRQQGSRLDFSDAASALLPGLGAAATND